MSQFVLFLIIWILNVSKSYCGGSDPCEPGKKGIYPHPKECQLYYNCSLPTHEFKPWLGKHVMECNYPDLFRRKTLRCEGFENVRCGTRQRFDNACEYRNNMCNGPLCKPCMSSFTCKGRSCDYTMTMIQLTCPRGEDGKLKIIDDSMCKPVKKHMH